MKVLGALKRILASDWIMANNSCKLRGYLHQAAEEHVL